MLIISGKQVSSVWSVQWSGVFSIAAVASSSPTHSVLGQGRPGTIISSRGTKSGGGAGRQQAAASDRLGRAESVSSELA